MVPLAFDEFATAPLRLSASGLVRAPAASVFAELGDPSRWFPLMTSCVWRGQVGGVGSERDVHVRLLGRFCEKMLVWQPAAGDDQVARVTFTMTETSSPIISRMAEDYLVTPEPDGVRLDWTLAATPVLIARPATPIVRWVLRRMFAKFRRRLEELAVAHAAMNRSSNDPVRGTPAS